MIEIMIDYHRESVTIEGKEYHTDICSWTQLIQDVVNAAKFSGESLILYEVTRELPMIKRLVREW